MARNYWQMKKLNKNSQARTNNSEVKKYSILNFDVTKRLSWILVSVTFLFYSNILYNDYCLDDVMAITQNGITQKGFSGIREHITNDFLYGYRHSNSADAASSRWRPLALITYSVEIGLWGNNHPERSHFIDLILYTAIVLLIFHWLNKYIIKHIWIAFFSALLFAIHPIHTEVVANIKSRDELLCLLFGLIALVFLWKYFFSEKIIYLLTSLFAFFISLTAKENTITLIAGIPLTMYFFSQLKYKQIFKISSLFLAVSVLYILVRNHFVPLFNLAKSDEVMNNPFLYATPLEAFATKIYGMWLYLKMLFFPYPLCYDYSFHQINYKTFYDIEVSAISLLLVSLFILGLIGLRSKNWLSYCIIMLFITLSICSNFIIEIGAIVAERLVFFTSVFLCLGISIIGYKCVKYLHEKFKFNKLNIGVTLFAPIFLLSAFQTIKRNKDWKDDNTLNIVDVSKCSKSARINNGAGGAYINLSAQSEINKTTKDSFIQCAIECLNHAIQIHPKYDDAYLNLGVAYSRIDSFKQAEKYWGTVKERSPAHPKLKEFDAFLSTIYLNKGLICGSNKRMDSAIIFLKQSVFYAKNNDSLMLTSCYNLGGALFTTKNFEEAKIAFKKALNINPHYTLAKTGLMACELELNKK